MENTKIGTLYVVATPIGNLQDMTFRAVETLKKIDRIAAEDTRHSSSLLKHYAINKPSLSLHEHNERERYKELLECLMQGEDIALISDGGTPLISDPGYRLVKAAKEAGINVVPIPGPSALIAALCVAGLPTDRFVFEGFLSAKPEAKRNELERLNHEHRTLIFYEAPHRLKNTIEVMCLVFGPDRKVVIARELTKVYEEVISHTLAEWVDYFANKQTEIRGEVVLLVKGEEVEQLQKREVLPEAVLDALLEELPLKQAASLASKITGERKNVLYDLALQKQNKK